MPRQRHWEINCALSCSVISDSLQPHELAHQTPLYMGFSRQEYWSGLPFLSLGDLPHPGIELPPPPPPVFCTYSITAKFFTPTLPEELGNHGAVLKGLWHCQQSLKQQAWLSEEADGHGSYTMWCQVSLAPSTLVIISKLWEQISRDECCCSQWGQFPLAIVTAQTCHL